jgi:serine protease Do
MDKNGFFINSDDYFAGGDDIKKDEFEGLTGRERRAEQPGVDIISATKNEIEARVGEEIEQATAGEEDERATVAEGVERVTVTEGVERANAVEEIGQATVGNMVYGVAFGQIAGAQDDKENADSVLLGKDAVQPGAEVIMEAADQPVSFQDAVAADTNHERIDAKQESSEIRGHSYSSWQPILPKQPIEQADENIIRSDIVYSPASHHSQSATHDFYKENIKKKPKKKRIGAGRYVLVSFLGAILGGAVMFFGISYLAFNTDYFSKNAPQSTRPDVSAIVKQYEFDVIDSPVMAIYEKVSPSIVGIRLASTYSYFFFGETEYLGEGSGIVIRSDGYILTNNHVITGDTGSFGQFPGGGGGESSNAKSSDKIEVILPDDKTKVYPATVVGRDSKTDLAVLKIDATGLVAAELGDSDLLKPGELAVAIGNPGGMDFMSSVTDGIISGLNRTVRTEDGKEFNLIQTNAALNNGNSGGALVNSKGQVIGINTIKVYQTGYEGLGFAIPINAAKEVANNLIDFNYVRGRAKIGIVYAPEFNDKYEYFNKQYSVPKGVYVVRVEPLSGAFKAGVKEGDIITKMNGEAIEDYNDLIRVRDSLKPGDIIPIDIYREGKTQSLELELSEDIGEFTQN